MELIDAYAVPGAAAGAIAFTQFVSILWSKAAAAQKKTIAALSALGITSLLQWDILTGGDVAVIVGVLLSGVTAGLAAQAGFDQIKSTFVN